MIFAWWCDRYQTLPGAGGIFDQDYREMYLNDVLPRIYEAVTNWRTHGGTGLSNSDRSIINWLIKTGLMNRNG